MIDSGWERAKITLSSRIRRIGAFWSPLRIAGGVAILFAVIVGRIGYLNNDVPWIQDLYPNIAVDMASIAIALLVIDVLYERRSKIELKRRLIREMGSASNSIALRAVVELDAYGWTRDGSLENANFYKANLEGAWLDKAMLRKAGLHHADLRNAFIVNADLRNAGFWESDLEGASLTDSDLQGAHFGDANLQKTRFFDSDLRQAFFEDADLTGAKLLGANLLGTYGLTLEQLSSVAGLSWATMPDGSRYDGRLNLSYDLEYAEYEGYDPNDPSRMASWYNVSIDQYQEGQRSLEQSIATSPLQYHEPHGHLANDTDSLNTESRIVGGLRVASSRMELIDEALGDEALTEFAISLSRLLAHVNPSHDGLMSQIADTDLGTDIYILVVSGCAELETGWNVLRLANTSAVQRQIRVATEFLGLAVLASLPRESLLRIEITDRGHPAHRLLRTFERQPDTSLVQLWKDNKLNASSAYALFLLVTDQLLETPTGIAEDLRRIRVEVHHPSAHGSWLGAGYFLEATTGERIGAYYDAARADSYRDSAQSLISISTAFRTIFDSTRDYLISLSLSPG